MARVYFSTGLGLFLFLLLPGRLMGYPQLQLVDDVALNSLINTVIDSAILDENFEDMDSTHSRRLGQGICRVANGSQCYDVKSLGEGICRAAKGSQCYDVKNLGQGICRAAKKSQCYEVSSLGQGICRAADGVQCYDVKNIGQGLCRAAKKAQCYDIQ